MSKTTHFFKHTITRYVLFGLALGASFPLIATVIYLLTNDQSITLENTIQAHRFSPLLWMIDFVPLVLAMVGFIIGWNVSRVHLQAQKLHVASERLKLANKQLSKKAESLEAQDEDKRTRMERLALLVSTSMDMMCIIHAKTFQIEALNPGTAMLLLKRDDQLKGSSIFDHIHEDDAPQVEQTLLQAFEKWERHQTIETRLVKSNGDIAWVSWQCVLNQDYWYINARDITDKKKSEQKISDTLSQLSNLKLAIDKTAMVSISDANNRIVWANEKLCTLTKYGKEELLDNGYSLFKSDAHPPAFYEGLRRTIYSGNIWRSEIKYRAKDGHTVVVDQTIVPAKNKDGEIESFLSIGFDVTYRKLVEEKLMEAKEAAEVAARAKADFLATMSHEIRTPMNAVIGMTSLLMDTELSKEQREFAETIKLGGENLLAVINDILDYSKIESGKLELEKRSVEVRRCVEGVFDVLAPNASAKGLELLYEIEEGVPERIIGDMTRINQVLLNLVGNAIKFTEDGEIFISVRLAEEYKHSKAIEFAVRDTGIGIPEAKLNRLFKSFSQVDSSTTRKYGGTGLGLAISKKLVELMGGEIGVESTEGEGSVFSFTIEAKVDTSYRRLEHGSPVALAGKKLLVVDDNETNLRIIKLRTERWDMQVTCSKKPEKALELIKKEAFDVALLDMKMPGLDGEELATAIRLHRSAEELPLILLSSVNSYPSQRLNNLFAAVMLKPVKQQQLQESLREVLADKTALPQATNQEVAEENNNSFDTSQLSILVAEDNMINQKVANRILEKMGYTATFVDNGKEAVEKVQAGDFDLILMDVQMPEMDGLEASRYLNKLYPNPNDRPLIVAMTANAMEGDREKCLKAGMDDYISKPVKPDALQLIIDKYFKQQAQQQIA